MDEQENTKILESGCFCPEETPMHVRIVQNDNEEKTIPLKIRIKRKAKDWDDENFKRWETVAFAESAKFITLFITLNIAIIGLLFGLIFPQSSSIFSCYFEKIFLSLDVILFLSSLILCLFTIFNRYNYSQTKALSFRNRGDYKSTDLSPSDKRCTTLSSQYAILQKLFILFFILGFFCFLFFAFYFFLR